MQIGKESRAQESLKQSSTRLLRARITERRKSTAAISPVRAADRQAAWQSAAAKQMQLKAR